MRAVEERFRLQQFEYRLEFAGLLRAVQDFQHDGGNLARAQGHEHAMARRYPGAERGWNGIG
jgi:hypothetical protein